MLTTTASPRRRLLLQATATLALLLLVGFTVLMHSAAGQTAGHGHPMLGTAASAEHGSVAAGHGEHAAPAGAVTTVSTDADADGGGGLCALMCSLMGMACAVTIALFTWALVRARTGGVLHLLARLLALADRPPRPIAARRPPSRTALQVIRV